MPTSVQGRRSIAGAAMRLLVRSLELQCAGDVVGVDVGVERERQRQAESLHFGQVALDAVDHRVDQQRLPGLLAAEQVGVGARQGLEEAGGRSSWGSCPVARVGR
jgi:hypothetical protein